MVVPVVVVPAVVEPMPVLPEPLDVVLPPDVVPPVVPPVVPVVGDDPGGAVVPVGLPVVEG